MIVAALLLLAQDSREWDIRPVGAPPSLGWVDGCVRGSKVDLPHNAATRRPVSGYRLVFTLFGDQHPLENAGQRVEQQHPDVRMTPLPVMLDNMLYTIEFPEFRGDRKALKLLTTEVCQAAYKEKVRFFGWQLLVGNKTAAGSFESVSP